MLFKITRYYLKGRYKGQERSNTMTFSSQKAADEWAEQMSYDLRNPFIVIETTPTSRFNEVHHSY